MIICTTPEQLSEWTKCEHFQIDLSFKRVAGEINEFEVNYYNSQHNLSMLILLKKNLLIFMFIFIDYIK